MHLTGYKDLPDFPLVFENEFRVWQGKRSRRWAFDLDGLKTAKEYLGLEWPVIILPVLDRVYCGQYMLDHDQPKHAIQVSTGLKRAFASRTIWHELMHAAQVEFFGSQKGFFDRYGATDLLKEDQLDGQPEEQQAYWAERLHDSVAPLTRNSLWVARGCAEV